MPSNKSLVGGELFPLLIGCDSRKLVQVQQKRIANQLIDMMFDELSTWSNACPIHMYPQQPQNIPLGYGYAIGPGTAIDQLLFCFHVHAPFGEAVHHLTVETGVKLDISESEPGQPLHPIYSIY